MQRINTPDGQFHAGDPSTGALGTIVTRDFMQSMQEELAGAVEGAGLILDPNNNAQLLAAINKLKLTGVTPPQFDVSTKTATMEALTRMGFQFAAFQVINTAGAFTATDAGKMNFVSTSVARTLPLASSVPRGATIGLTFNTTGSTLGVSGTDALSTNSNSGNNLFTSQAGDRLCVVSDGVGVWYSVWETTQAFVANQFRNGLLNAANGYQKFPAGMILQWFSVSTSASADTVVTWPVAFPNAIRSVALGVGATVATYGNYFFDGTNSNGLAGAKVNAFNSSGARVSATLSGLAWGY
ncbi:gp53-like domain-containing protein [Burkholderia vietnamiensis]|uniref:gp53-like domain-containing protein n=1 Tax=Burkholderia vietnamiensis TaxID=60552 RepID=UPI0015898916|nr:hypothetical protein [Burkholderia vietnamiensis]